MKITQVKLQGFRNFKEATINLEEKCLIIGPNEVGKSNFLFALRILLDPTLAEADLEPQDSDFYAFEDTERIQILIQFSEVHEDCVVAKFREHVSDGGELFIAYEAKRGRSAKEKNYKILLGQSPDALKEIEGRFYLRVLNLKFMDSRRDLSSFMRRERRNLIQDAKTDREADAIQQDNRTLKRIGTGLERLRRNVSELSYIKEATGGLNEELSKLSFQNESSQIVFDTGATDTSLFVDNLRLASQVNGKTLAIGGDGKNNQIQLALWAARNKARAEIEEEPLEVSIYCIEEPEAHLHPHQQRKLANYLSPTLQAQVIITTHSPQIACEFSPASLIRLYNNSPDTLAACGGCSPHIEQAFIQFGHRLNIIPSEAFFSSVVLLVEGRSEELFYKALADKIGIDLDRLNVSVLIVDGIGFEPFIALLRSLNIPFVMRTDNDIFQIPKKKAYRFAGIQRAVNICQNYYQPDKKFTRLLGQRDKLQGFRSERPPEGAQKVARKFIRALEKYDIFLSDVDLEHDVHDALRDVTAKYFNLDSDEEIICEMQKQKATFMFAFLREHSDALGRLADHHLAKPLLRCKAIVETLP